MKKLIITIAIIATFIGGINATDYTTTVGYTVSLNDNTGKDYTGDDEDEEEESSAQEEASVSQSAVVMNQFSVRAKKLNTTFTGFKVQLHNSASPISEDHRIFSDFGKITLEHTDAGYAYSVGTFKSAKQAQEYVDKIIGDRYEAVVVQYENGQRK